MCKSAIEIEFQKIFMEQSSFKQEYVLMLKEKINSNNKQLKRIILSIFMNNISNGKSLALFDEDIFNIYKTIIDNYINFLNRTENIEFKFNNEVLKNLSGITSVLKSQVSFFGEDKDVEINPIYTEKKTIITKYIDNVYKSIDNFNNIDIFNNSIDIKDIKQYFIDEIIKYIMDSYKTNLIDCFNAINDIENRKEIKYFNDVLEEEREILASIIKLQIKALEDLCKDETEKASIESLLNPIIETYQQTGKSFELLNEKIKTINRGIDIDFETDSKEIEQVIYNIYKEVKLPEDEYKQKILEIFEQYLLNLKQSIILEQRENIDLAKSHIENSLNLSNNIKNMFNQISQYINDNREYYKNSDLYNIIDGIYESISIKVDNIQEKQDEVFLNKDKIYLDIDNNLDQIKNLNIEYDFNTIYDSLKNDFNLDQIEKHINTKSIVSSLEKLYSPYIKKIDEFIKNTILFEISTFQEIIYYSVVRLRECEDENIKYFTKYIDNMEYKIENTLIENSILPIKPNPHDMFDPKEHEVLLAEKNEQFLKGQIIKVVNYGYKKKDKGIIKRATIIAAK